MRSVPVSIARVLAWSTIYLAVATTTNFVFDINFGERRAKPSYISLFDYMAPWPWPFYIMQLVLLAIVSCLIIYSPYFLVDYGGR